MEEQDRKEQNHAFFTHRQCEYFPCHPGIAPNAFNCLFCYCPLYPLGEDCGGDFLMLENGVKDCSGCGFPHKKENYDKITGEFDRIVQLFSGK